MRSWLRRVCSLLAVVLPALAAGCAQMDLNQSNSWPFAEEEEYGEPTQLIAVWADTVLTRADGPSVHGFGGRLMFYDHGSTRPIKVKGRLVVYAYDDSEHNDSKVEPDRKYVFRAEDLENHYSESRVGHSYSVWLPWRPVGGEQKEITLIARFKTDEGNEVVGEATHNVLPGTVTKPAEAKTFPRRQAVAGETRDEQVRWVSHQAPVPAAVSGTGGEPAPDRRMVTTTIPLPPRGTLQMPAARVTQVRSYPESPERKGAAHDMPGPAFDQQGAIPAASRPAECHQPEPAPPQAPARYSPSRFPARDGPSARPGFSRARWQRFPGAWPYGPGPTPPAESASEAGPSE